MCRRVFALTHVGSRNQRRTVEVETMAASAIWDRVRSESFCIHPGYQVTHPFTWDRDILLGTI